MLDLALQPGPSSVVLIREENPIQESVGGSAASCELVR